MNKGIYYSIFTAFLWGFLAIGLKVALADVSPLTVTWFRFTLAFGVLVLYYLIFNRERLKILIHPPVLAVIAGVALGGNYVGFITGVHLTSPTIAQVFIQTGPVMLAIAGVVIFKEKFSLRQGIGLLIVLLGLAIFYYDTISIIVSGEVSNFNTGVLWLLFGAFSWVIYGVFQKKEVVRYNPMQLNLLIFGVPALLLIPTAEFEVFPTLNFNQWMLMAYLGLNTLAAYGSLAYALKYLEANKVSVIVTLNPLITFAAMAYLSEINVSWIESESYSLLTIIGAVTALTGVILTVLRRERNT